MNIITRNGIFGLLFHRLQFLFVFLLLLNGSLAYPESRTLKLGAVLDCSSRAGKEEKVAIEIAVDDIQALFDHPPICHVKDSRGDPSTAASYANNLIKKHHVNAIIGFGTQELSYIAELGNRTRVPMLSLNKEAPPWSSWQWPYVVNAARSQHEQMKAVAAIVQSFQWRRVTVIYEDTSSGEFSSLIPYLVTALQEAESQISEFLPLPSYISNLSLISEKLEGLKNGQSRVFIVHTSFDLANQIFLEAKKHEMMEKGFVWITTVATANLIDNLNASVISSMQGVLGVKSYVPREGKKFSTFLSKFIPMFNSHFPEESYQEPGIFALQAYGAVWSVAMALNEGTKVNPLKDEIYHDNGRNSIDGQWLLDRILQSDFRDLMGRFRYTEKSLDPGHNFQMINVVGKSYRELGFWTVGLGFSHSVGRHDGTYNKSMKSLERVFWPGGSWKIPRGWALPKANVTLKIGVPIGGAFKEFVNVKYDSPGGMPKFGGFCIKVFRTVVNHLPYQLPYQLIPFSGTYDSLIEKIKLKEIDAIVGDTAIVAHRYEYAEFSQPYSEVGLQMLLYDEPKTYERAWLFMRPFTTILWVSTGLINVYNGFVVWLIERRHNQEWGGSWWNQIGTMLSLAFSTLLAHQRDTLHSNLSWMLVIPWLFVALILTQSYTASLTAFLTSEQIGTIVDIKSLKRTDAKIGCNGNSFVPKYLEVVHGINPDNIKKMYSEDDYPTAFRNGDIKAAFLQIPQVNLFLVKNCDDGFRRGQTFNVAGFGYVLPKGSPYLTDISAAIVKLSQNGKLQELQDSFLNANKCISPSDKPGQKSLGISSFLGLFLITGGISTLTLVIFIITQFRQQWYRELNRRHRLHDPHKDEKIMFSPEMENPGGWS